MIGLDDNVHLNIFIICYTNPRFGNECTCDGKLYPQGVGKTKKEAKTNAATIAFRAVIGLDDNVHFTVVAPSKLDALYGEGDDGGGGGGIPGLNGGGGAEGFQKSKLFCFINH